VSREAGDHDGGGIVVEGDVPDRRAHRRQRDAVGAEADRQSRGDEELARRVSVPIDEVDDPERALGVLDDREGADVGDGERVVDREHRLLRRSRVGRRGRQRGNAGERQRSHGKSCLHWFLLWNRTSSGSSAS
jgi:hypothetical protein